MKRKTVFEKKQQTTGKMYRRLSANIWMWKSQVIWNIEYVFRIKRKFNPIQGSGYSERKKKKK